MEGRADRVGEIALGVTVRRWITTVAVLPRNFRGPCNGRTDRAESASRQRPSGYCDVAGRESRRMPTSRPNISDGRGPAVTRIVVEAPAGYGKTHFVRSLAGGLPAPVPADGVDAFLVRGDRERTLVADEVERWTTDEQRRLARHLAFESSDVNMVVCGRRLHSELFDAMVFLGARVIGIDELRIGRHELADALDGVELTDDQLDQLDRLIDGWPAIVRPVVDDVIRHGSTAGLTASHPDIVARVERCLDVLDARDLDALGQLSHLDTFSSHVVRTMGDGLLDRLRAAGIPMERVDRRGIRLVAPVREVLRLRSDLDADVARQFSVALVQSALPIEAAHVLIRCDAQAAAAQLLTALTTQQLDRVPPHLLLSTLDLLGTHVEDHLRLLLVKARALESTARLDEQRDTLERARRLAVDVGDHDVADEARAESLFARAMSGVDHAGLRDEIAAVRRETDDSAVSVHTLLLGADSLVLAQSDDPDDLSEAAALSAQTADAWQIAGDRSRAAAALRTRAMVLLMPMGRLCDAREMCDRALALTPDADLDRMSTLLVTLRCDALSATHVPGRMSEAAALAAGLSLEWAEAYVSWSRLLQIGLGLETADPVSEFEVAWAKLGELRDHPTGALLLVEASESFSRRGQISVADELLERARPRRGDASREFDLAELACAAHARRPNVSELADELDRSLLDWPGLRWKVPMYRAIASDAPSDVVGWTRVAERLAEPWCGDGIVGRCAPSLISRSDDDPGADADDGPAVPTPADPLDRLDTGDTTIQIRVLGGFDVVCSSGVVPSPGDRCIHLLKTIATGRGHVPVDVVTDRLWPDAAADIGRRRLKNVLTRTRQACGDVIERVGDTLQFTDCVRLDLVDFSERCTSALRGLAEDAPTGVAQALQALALYRGPVLADDLYDDDVAPLRTAEMGRAASLVDAVLASSNAPLVGPALFDALVRIDPDDIDRFERLALWADEVGESGLASTAARQVEHIATELGFPVSKAVIRLIGAPDMRTDLSPV